MKFRQIFLVGFLTILFLAVPCLVARADYSINTVSFNGTSYNVSDLSSPITLQPRNSELVNIVVNLSGAADANCTYEMQLSIGSASLSSYTSTSLPITGSSITFSIPLSTSTYDGDLVIYKYVNNMGTFNYYIPFSLVVPAVDTTAPAITSRYPAANATSASLSTNITVNVSKNLNASTVNANSISLKDAANNPIACSISVNNSGSTSVITLNPTADLIGSTDYTVEILGNLITDTSNNYLPAATWSFTTEGLNIDNEYPRARGSNFPIDNAISFNFNRMVMPSTVSNSNIYLQRYDDATKISADVSYNNSDYRVILKPSKPLEYDTRYRIFVTNGIKDINNTSFIGTDWYFTTEERDDGSLIYAKNPAPDETNVPTDQSISFRFSSRMDEDTIDDDTVYLRRDGSSSDVDADITYDENTRTVTLTPDDSLRLNTEYTIYVSSRIEDYNGNRISSAKWSFTTGDFETSRIKDRDPYPNEDDVPLDARVIIEFSDNMNEATIKTSGIYLRKSGSTSNVKCDISYNSLDREVILAPLEDLFPNAAYTVYITSKVEDAAGNKLSPANWNFTTEERSLRLIYRYPEIGSYQVPVDSEIKAGFSMPLTANTVKSSNCTLTRYGNFYGAGSTTVPAKVSYDKVNNLIVIKPSAKLAYNTQYTVTLSNRIKDYTGIFIRETSWSFTTMADPTPRGTPYNPLVKVGGSYLKFAGAGPYIINGRTMVPYRTIVEALGAEVTWEGSQQKITTALNNNSIELYIGRKVAYKNGRNMTLDVAPELRFNQTMIPLRFISESLGKRVTWDNDTCTVSIQ